ncbi:hypothetical protein LINGRAHAP2_LOCUS31234 [Linum grandiflorum]
MHSKSDMVSVRLTGKNFALWEFQYRIFVQGRRLLSILDGSKKKPTDAAPDKDKDDWAANNAQVITWILASMEPVIALSLQKFSTAHDMWKHLNELHSQTNTSRKFELEHDIARLQQGGFGCDILLSGCCPLMDRT